MSSQFLVHRIFPPFPSPRSSPELPLKSTRRCARNSSCEFNAEANSKSSANWCCNLISIAISVALVAPSQAIPYPSPGTSRSTTPFSQSQNLPTGLENGKIRPCPSINPSCISTNPRSSNFVFPWRILGDSTNTAAIQKLQEALGKTQKNLKMIVVEDTPNGEYLRAEVDGGLGRDVVEFLVNGSIVSFRAMATKVTYVYPFTTAFGDSKGQEERMKHVVSELGWYAPDFDAMD